MIIGIFGDPREGKTLSAVNEIREIIKREPWRRVYSNISLKFSHEIVTPDMVTRAMEGKYTFADDSIIFVDEIYLWLDARSSTSKMNKVISWWLMQTGKMGKNTDIGCIFIYTSQYPRLIDLRLYLVTAIKVFVQRLDLPGRRLIKQFIIESRMRGDITKERVIDAEPIYKLYDTRQRVDAIKKEEKKKSKKRP